MDGRPLRPTPFRGDPDVPELHAFFQPERQFAGDTLWTFGKSLKSAYVDCFEFLNHPPIVQLWRDASGAVQAVSRIMLGMGEWFHLAAPGYRRPDVSHAILEQADAAFELLTSAPEWHAVVYASDASGAKRLEQAGYAFDAESEVHMTRSLRDPIPGVGDPPGCTLRTLDADDPAQVLERGRAQADAFIDGQPLDEVLAWMGRTMRHQIHFGRPTKAPHVVAMDGDGVVHAFAETFLDTRNGIGEFEPVGTRRAMQRKGLSKAVLLRALAEMRAAGMQQAVVRTGLDNPAALAAYASVGFEVTDRLLRYRKARTARGGSA